MIRMQSVRKSWGNIHAVSGVNFDLAEGEIHALLGENGAGKSTLMKMLAGAVIPDAGTLLLDDKPLRFSDPADAMAAGIAMVYQENSLVPSMTVAQNLFLGEEKAFNRLRPLYIAAQQFLQSLSFHVDPWAQVASLGVAQRQMVEIARAVRKKARVIIFDEPTASLTPEEKHHFFDLLRRLRQGRVSIVFISHALEEALEISDRITVLRDGVLVDAGMTRDFDRARIVSAMVGRDAATVQSTQRQASRPPGRRVLSVQNLSLGNLVRNTSFSLFEGQVTGIFGLIGSGRTEMAKILAGVIKRNIFHGGEVLLDERPVRYRVPRSAVRDGIVYVTEDRKVEGFFGNMPISQNIGLGWLAAGFNRGYIVGRAQLLELARQ